MFLQREDHLKGLIRLLTIGLRLLTLVEFQVRRSLTLEKIEIAGLYAGNPKRSTA
jgi:transposase